jgi:hypothetical protein
MNTKHTPGPWLATVTDTTCGGEPAIWEITDKHGGVIAEDISYNPANANLIASAPDMLDALQRIESSLEHEPEIYSDILSVARAAIAKAIGKQ